MRSRRAAGFTLLEVMIALAVFAVVSAALVRNAAVAVRQTTIIEDRSLGIWVAENQLSQMRIRSGLMKIIRPWGPIGTQ